MNKRQKELLQHQLDREQAILKELEQQYRRALDDILQNVRILQSDELTQSKVYQLQYQQALKGTIEAAIEKLHSGEFTTIQQYLEVCYTNGFVGTMYDLAWQGIPMILPIDQKAMIRAIQTDSKINTTLYEALGIDTKKLKRTIRQEITRGLAEGMATSAIARNISNASRTPLYNAKRIARTEGHRVLCSAQYDAQQESISHGADVVKQWDSTLDGNTRPTHRQLDGQIREVDEPFEAGGKTAMYPGAFGEASEDCNCRCSSLSRARSALDERELETLKERAEYFGLDKTEDFEEFKKRYLEISENNAPESGKRDIINVDYVKSTYGHTHADAVKQQLENADSDVREVWNRYSGDFRTDDPTYSGSRAYYMPSSDSVTLNINRAASGSSYQAPYQVLHHEYGHMTDYLAARRYGHSRYTAFTEVFAGLDEDGKPIFNSEYGSRGLLGETARNELKNLLSQIKKTNGVRRKAEAAQILIDEIKSNYSLLARSDVSDMLEGAGIGVAYPLGVGHGTNYWKDRDNGKEIFAEMLSAEAASPESLACIQQYFPETYKVFRTILGVIK